ncbi:MAG: hypothetical protein M3N13_01945 [Candidatus Eremiobacteraeota bacterium]|nr:hypothetical protein [Candidatus Eremiobacteraeota bacterium]
MNDKAQAALEKYVEAAKATQIAFDAHADAWATDREEQAWSAYNVAIVIQRDARTKHFEANRYG